MRKTCKIHTLQPLHHCDVYFCVFSYTFGFGKKKKPTQQHFCHLSFNNSCSTNIVIYVKENSPSEGTCLSIHILLTLHRLSVGLFHVIYSKENLIVWILLPCAFNFHKRGIKWRSLLDERHNLLHLLSKKKNCFKFSVCVRTCVKVSRHFFWAHRLETFITREEEEMPPPAWRPRGLTWGWVVGDCRWVGFIPVARRGLSLSSAPSARIAVNSWLRDHRRGNFLMKVCGRETRSTIAGWRSFRAPFPTQFKLILPQPMVGGKYEIGLVDNALKVFASLDFDWSTGKEHLDWALLQNHCLCVYSADKRAPRASQPGFLHYRNQNNVNYVIVALTKHAIDPERFFFLSNFIIVTGSVIYGDVLLV